MQEPMSLLFIKYPNWRYGVGGGNQEFNFSKIALLKLMVADICH